MLLNGNGKGASSINRKSKGVARPERFELPTLWFEARCSIQLSYGRTRASVPVHLGRFKARLLGREASAWNWQRTGPPGISAVLLAARDCRGKTSAFRSREQVPLGNFRSCSIE